MAKKTVEIEQVMTTISVRDVLDSVGILGVKLIKDMENTDPNDWYEKWLEMKDDFETSLVVMGMMEKRYRSLFGVLMYDLPDGTGAVAVANPLREPKTKKRTSDEDSASGDVNGGDSIIDDKPPF